MGDSLISKTCRLYDKEKQQIVEKRDVLFDETNDDALTRNHIMFDIQAKIRDASDRNAD